MSRKGDYLDAMGRDFTDRRDFVEYLEKDYGIASFAGEFNIIGAINNLPGGKQAFLERLQIPFTDVDSSGDLHLIRTELDEEYVYYYVYLHEETPVFFTTANKTDEIPPTIWRFLQSTEDVGRLMLSKRQIDDLRKKITSDHHNILVPYFSARRNEDSPIASKIRPETERSIQYRANDGLQTYREFRYNYGILPKIMVFERPGRFKFRVKDEGIFIHQSGSLLDLWNYVENEISRAVNMKKYANKGEYKEVKSSFFEENGFNISTPWAVRVNNGIERDHLGSLENQLSSKFWEFNVSEYRAQPELPAFQAEVIDDSSHERTTMKSKGDQVRIFPREHTDIDQSLRIYNFISDHFDSDCEPLEVA